MKRKPKHTKAQRAAFDVPTITRECEYIAGRALEGEGCVVTLGPLVFFSTETGDAWVLDPSDGHAHCLLREGERTPLTVMDRGGQVAIEWTASYAIDGDAFTFADSQGRMRNVLGYPTRQILAAGARFLR